MVVDWRSRVETHQRIPFTGCCATPLGKNTLGERQPLAVQCEEVVLFISEISASVPPINDDLRDRREFPSPDRSWLAVFHDPYEWHMGAIGWQLSVSSSKTKSVVINPDLEKLSNGKGLVCPLDYSPWSADSKVLALCFWESGLVFFEPLANNFQVINLHAHIVQWSPTANHLLVFVNSQFAILDKNGNVLNKVGWETAEHELPRAGWMPSGTVFFIIGRTSKRAKPRITFVNAENGTIVANELLNPEKLVPYNSDEYKSVPRGRYSLVLSPSTRSVGSLLDTWNDMNYDQEKGMIFLSVYRPISKVYELDGNPVCQVSAAGWRSRFRSHRIRTPTVVR